MSAPARRGDRPTLILGCGFTGCMLAQRLGFRGEPVIGTTRSDTRALVIRSRGAEPLMLDLGGAEPDLSPLAKLRGKVGRIVSCVPPRVDRDGTMEDPHEALLAFLNEGGASDELEAFVYVSATSVWGDQGGARVDEHTPVAPDSPRGKARVMVERTILDTPLGGARRMVVRAAGIYGRGRSQLHRLAAGRYRLVGDGAALTNRIHVRDLAALIDAALVRGADGAAYLGSDLAPTAQAVVVAHAQEHFDLPGPTRLSTAEARVRMTPSVFRMITGSKRLDPSWTLEQLDHTLRFPTYREGLEDIWRWEAPEIRALAEPSEAE